MIEQQYPREGPESSSPAGNSRHYHLMVFSAHTETACTHRAKELKAHLQDYPGVNIRDLEYALLEDSNPLACRSWLVFDNTGRKGEPLPDPEEGIGGFHAPGKAYTPIFLFPGGGVQHVNMGRGLYESEPYFRKLVDEGLDSIQQITGTTCFRTLYPENGRDHSEITDPELALPLLFTIEYALAKYLIHLGIVPAAMIGHSLGEYIAACVAGMFTYHDAMKIVCHRGRLMKKVEPGLMLSVACPVEELRSLVTDDSISIGAVNSPGHCMLSGRKENIVRARLMLERQDIQVKVIHISVASHSVLMEPILDEFRDLLKTIRMAPPFFPVMSNLYGDWHPSAAPDAEYWVRHLRETVLFSKGVQCILGTLPNSLFIEAGPGNTLSNLVRAQNAPAAPVVNLLRHPLTDTNDVHFFLNALGELWAHGCPIDRDNFINEGQRNNVTPPVFLNPVTGSDTGRIDKARDRMGKMRSNLKK